MIRLNQAVIVEGKYDKIALQNVIDATIIPTNGFGIFKNKEKCELIRTLAFRDGIIVMTDSDGAGQLIRSYLKRICSGGKIIQVYIPQLKGKESRKSVPGKEGLLGVEGMTVEILTAALLRSGVMGFQTSERRKEITKTDLFLLGLSGRNNSALLRKQLMKSLALPLNLSGNAFLEIINTLYSREEFKKKVKQWQEEMDKS